LLLVCSTLYAQSTAAQSTAVQSAYIASTRSQTLQAAGVQISGDVRMANGSMQLGNGSTITAGNDTLPISLTRGGELRLCATTSLHLSRDGSIQTSDASGLMLGLDRGAIEAHYPTSKYSDVLLTPDLRILISGPGDADVSVRVSRSGDTCIDNRGPHAPYITVTSPLEGGLYRVQPGQHVSFQHGSLREVVDTEKEPCGCPPAAVVAVASADPGKPVGGPSSTPADTAFPLAISEGLTKTPLPAATPVAAPGEVHAQVAVPFRFSGDLPTVAPPATSAGTPAEAAPAAETAVAIPPPSPAAPAPSPTSMPAPTIQPPPPGSMPVTTELPAQTALIETQAQTTWKPPSRGFFHRVGHLIARFFGAEE
jgi:hypothetical protein